MCIKDSESTRGQQGDHVIESKRPVHWVNKIGLVNTSYMEITAQGDLPCNLCGCHQDSLHIVLQLKAPSYDSQVRKHVNFCIMDAFWRSGNWHQNHEHLSQLFLGVPYKVSSFILHEPQSIAEIAFHFRCLSYCFTWPCSWYVWLYRVLAILRLLVLQNLFVLQLLRGSGHMEVGNHIYSI